MNPGQILELLIRMRSSIRRMTTVGGYVIHNRPIFVIGCPRSGTTMLYNIFRKSSRLSSLRGSKGLEIWERFHSTETSIQWSHTFTEADVSPEERAFIHQTVHALCGRKRFVEKRARNCLRVSYLHALFPDAVFVCLRRDGRDNVNSLLQGWKSERYHGALLPLELKIRGYGGTHWKFAVPPGWWLYVERALEEVCSFQWIACNEALLRGRTNVPQRSWIEVKYEDIVRDPVSTISRIFDAVDLPFEPRVERYCHALEEHPVNYLTPPRLGKWKDENREAILRILPMIEPTMAKLDYSIAHDVGAEWVLVR